MKRVYLDHAATTPMLTEVGEVVRLAEAKFGNPSSGHQEGREARALIDASRTIIAKELGVETNTLIFTSGATEANVASLRGVLFNQEDQAKEGVNLCISKIEHPSIIETVRQLEKEGVVVSWAEVNRYGLIKEESLSQSVNKDTVLVSIALANHELGTKQDIKALVALVKEINPNALFHTDMVQAFGWEEVNIAELGVDLATISAHKIYGPKGVGLLYLKKGIDFRPLLPGMQEWGKRGGTESPSLIVGFAKAVELCRTWDPVKTGELRDYLIEQVLEKINEVEVNTPMEQSVPHIAHFSFKGLEAQLLSMALDQKGVAASSGSACSSGAVSVSHIIEALNINTEEYGGSLRLSLGIETTREELDFVVQQLVEAVGQLRR